jgi:hypothetical protein
VRFYGFRYYDPETGRWPSRDPIGEIDFENIYCLLANNPVDDFDINGLFSFGSGWDKLKKALEKDTYYKHNYLYDDVKQILWICEFNKKSCIYEWKEATSTTVKRLRTSQFLTKTLVKDDNFSLKNMAKAANWLRKVLKTKPSTVIPPGLLDKLTLDASGAVEWPPKSKKWWLYGSSETDHSLNLKNSALPSCSEYNNGSTEIREERVGASKDNFYGEWQKLW